MPLQDSLTQGQVHFNPVPHFPYELAFQSFLDISSDLRVLVPETLQTRDALHLNLLWNISTFVYDTLFSSKPPCIEYYGSSLNPLFCSFRKISKIPCLQKIFPEHRRLKITTTLEPVFNVSAFLWLNLCTVPTCLCSYSQCRISFCMSEFFFFYCWSIFLMSKQICASYFKMGTGLSIFSIQVLAHLTVNKMWSKNTDSAKIEPSWKEDCVTRNFQNLFTDIK